MAGQTGVQIEVFRDRFGVLLDDRVRGTLELQWLDGTTAMTDEDFKAWLTRFASEAERRRPPFLLIDMTRFGHRPGPGVAAWRDEHIIPGYNRAGVRKFAFIATTAGFGSSAVGSPPVPEPPGTFPTGYFLDRDQIEAWFAS
jgi:hypothetical protein